MPLLMATETRAISRAQFRKLVSPLIGLPVSKPRRGAANALNLELGKLQAGILIESHWRVERRGRFSFGSGKTSGIQGLRGLCLRNVALSHCGPELFLELEGGFHLHTFSDLDHPRWTLFLRDASLFPRIPPSAPLDPSLRVTVDGEMGRLVLQRSRRAKPGGWA